MRLVGRWREYCWRRWRRSEGSGFAKMARRFGSLVVPGVKVERLEEEEVAGGSLPSCCASWSRLILICWVVTAAAPIVMAPKVRRWVFTMARVPVVAGRV